MKLNQYTVDLCGRMVAAAGRLRIGVAHCPAGSRIIDCGVHSPGGLEAGRRLAEVCMAGMGEASFQAVSGLPWSMPAVAVRTEHPVAACLASQHAGWQVAVKKYSALGSGPMRALAGKEPLFETIGRHDTEPVAVGVLESGQLPNSEVCEHLARECGVAPRDLTLLVAPAASLAGAVQRVARTVAVAMRRLLELGFDVYRVESGFGVAPLPPVGTDDSLAVGRTLDAILYGGEVTLWVRGDDDSLSALGPKLPGEASAGYGQSFVRILERCDQDVPCREPDVCGPAVVNLVNLDTGRAFRFGCLAPEMIGQSFQE